MKKIISIICLVLMCTNVFGYEIIKTFDDETVTYAYNGRNGKCHNFISDVEKIYLAIEGSIDIDQLCNLYKGYYFDAYKVDAFDNTIVIRHTIDSIFNTTSFGHTDYHKLYNQIEYDLDFPEDTVPYSKVNESLLIGSSELNAGQMYKRLNEHYDIAVISGTKSSFDTNGVYHAGRGLNDGYWYSYEIKVKGFYFTTILLKDNYYQIVFQGLAKDVAQYKEKVQELIQVITTK